MQKKSDSSKLDLAAGVGVVLLVVVPTIFGWVGLARWRQVRDLRVDARTFERRLSALGAERLETGIGVAEWLTQHWRTRYPRHALITVDGLVQFALEKDGYPLLVDATMRTLRIGLGDTGAFRWWSRVSLAANFPPACEPTPAMREALARLSYQLRIEPGGAFVWADESTKALPAEERSAAIVELLDHLVELARAASASPRQAP